jgi:hypothetical protein
LEKGKQLHMPFDTPNQKGSREAETGEGGWDSHSTGVKEAMVVSRVEANDSRGTECKEKNVKERG